MDAIYTDTGQGNAKYRIVERYSNWDKYPDVHSYFFCHYRYRRGDRLSFPNDQWWKDVPKTNRQQGTSRRIYATASSIKKNKPENDCFSGFVYPKQ